jgi:hypothetical protein
MSIIYGELMLIYSYINYKASLESHNLYTYNYFPMMFCMGTSICFDI